MTTVPLSAFLRFIFSSPFDVLSASHTVGGKLSLGLVRFISASDILTSSKLLSRATDCSTGGFQFDLM